MLALTRYFNDTDLASPDQETTGLKGSSFFSGETVRKQVVLLNDLTRTSLADCGGS